MLDKGIIRVYIIGRINDREQHTNNLIHFPGELDESAGTRPWSHRCTYWQTRSRTTEREAADLGIGESQQV